MSSQGIEPREDRGVKLGHGNKIDVTYVGFCSHSNIFAI